MITISICMIVKNEAAILGRCLDSIADLADELIIVDTGSTDDTIRIASGYTDHVFTYEWQDDFAAARNFAFSKATMEYIYSADADELLDEENRRRFSLLKQVLLPEIEIVQMKYVTKSDRNMVYNAKKELRPKLFRRLRPFTWIDPIHETVRLDPVVYDSDIEILHLPQSMHSPRDFSIFQKAFEREGTLSKKLIDMYAKELFISGTDADFSDALPIFEELYRQLDDPDLQKEIACVLAHAYRICDRSGAFFKLSLKDMLTTPCSEMCMEIGTFFFGQKDYEEAILWFYNAAYEAGSILNIRCSGDLPLLKLAECYRLLADQKETDASCDRALSEEYRRQSMEYQKLAEQWELPEEL